MKANKPHITTTYVEIKVLRVDNQKMTLSVFDQLPNLPFNELFKNDKYVFDYEKWGVVKRKYDNYVVVNCSGKLKKCNLSRIYHDITCKFVSLRHGWYDPRKIPLESRTQQNWDDIKILAYIDQLLEELPQLFIAT